MNTRVRVALAAAVVLGAVPPVLWGKGLEAPLSVAEPAGEGRTAEPISGGIPLPKGATREGHPLCVFRPGGEPVPCQVLPLVVDPDGSLRWVLVDFQDDLAAGQTKRYTLRPGRSTARPPRPIRVTDAASGVTIDTGKVKLTMSRTAPFGLFSAVESSGRRVVSGGRASYTDGFDGKTYPAARPTSVEAEWTGPMRVTVAVKGRFVGDAASKFQYVARITAWAGRSDVHVKYSLANTNPDHYCYRSVQDSTIALKLTAPPARSILGASKPIRASGEAELIETLLPSAAGAAWATDGKRKVWTTKGEDDQAEGWIAADVGGARIYACDLYFADDPPRRLVVAKGELILGGIMARPAAQAEARGAPYADTNRCLYDCSHLSSQYLIDFAAPAAAAELSAAARRAKQRLHLQAPPKWYLQEAEGMPYGRFGTQADEMVCFDTWGWKYDPKDAPQRPTTRKYRLGRFFRTIDNHYEPEEDPLDHMIIMYLRTGSRAYFEYALTWVNYAMDLYAWRTDGWRWRDGGVWWYSGPKGHRPQRAPDPITGTRNYLPGGRRAGPSRGWTPTFRRDAYYLANSKSCYCHNWAQGLLAWYLLTGDRDAMEAAVDRVEQDIDTLRRARQYKPGVSDTFSRDFTRASYNAHAARFVLPQSDFVRDASEFLAQVYLKRPAKEPRGLVNAAKPWRARRGLRGGLESWVGREGIAELKRLGYVFDETTGRMQDPKTGRSWYVLQAPHTWMFPPLSRAMELYYRLTGDEDAHDWTIAYGQAAARVLFQDHCLLSYGRMLVDFPKRGVAKDYASWVAKPGTYAEGVVMSGYLARFHPDVPGRAYCLCGEPLLKERAYGYWLGGSHRGYRTTKMMPLDRVGRWIDYTSTHDGQIDFVGRTIYVWAHPRADETPPEPVKDLKVAVTGDRARVTFTAPPDRGGGKVARYQLKCSDRPIADYEAFLKAFNEFRDGQFCNWWMAANLADEPAPRQSGSPESFVVTGVPGGARYFALRSFDHASNRSALSNVAQAGQQRRPADSR